MVNQCCHAHFILKQLATPQVKLQFISSIFKSFRGTTKNDDVDLGLVLNGVFQMFKDGVVLPQCMPKGTAEYDGWLAKLPQRVENGTEGHEKWLAKTRGHHDNKHAEEHKDGTHLAKCLECSAGPITINSEVTKVKKRERYIGGLTPIINGTHIFLKHQRCHKCWERHCNWRIEIKAVAPLKATAPVAKKTVVKKAAPRKHILLGFSRILRERKPRAAAPQKHSLRSLSEILNERKLREQALWHQ